MFILLKDTNPTLRKSLITYGLIVVNVLLFLFLKIRTVWFIGILIALEFFFELLTPNDGTAYIAHIGGFITGLVLYSIYHKYHLSRIT